MKTKLLSLVFFTILFSSLALAAVDININPSTLTFTASDTTAFFDIENTGNEPMNITSSFNDISRGSGVTYSFDTTDSLTNIQNGSSVRINVELNGNLDNFNSDSATLDINAIPSAGGNAVSDTLSLEFDKGFCEAGEQGLANVSIKLDVNNMGDSEDSDDDLWVLGDVVEVEVEVKNRNHDEDIDDIIVELGLFDSDGNNIADELDFISDDDEEQDLGDIRDGDEETATFTFRVPPDFNTESYTLIAKAYSDGDENILCAEEDFSTKVDQEGEEERFVIVDDIAIDDQAICGETVSGDFTVFNIGEDDQDRVKITMINEDLDLDEEFETTNLDEGDEEDFSFTFRVPEGISEGNYNIEFRSYYDYDDGVYKERSEDTFVGFLNVINCGSPVNPTPGNGLPLEVDASLTSEATSGEDLVVEATFTNTGTQAMTVLLDARDFNSWSRLVSISPQVLNLGAGETRSATFTLAVNDDTEGEQSFTIEANSNGNLVTQQVAVEFEEGQSGLRFDLDGSALIWVIAIVNIILIILIIVVAVRLSRR